MLQQKIFNLEPDKKIEDLEKEIHNYLKTFSNLSGVDIVIRPKTSQRIKTKDCDKKQDPRLLYRGMGQAAKERLKAKGFNVY